MILLLFSAGLAGGVIVNRIAAIVNDEVITTNQLDEKLALYKENFKNLPESEMDQARSQVLNVLIEETLVKQRIKELKITVSDSQVESAIQDVQKSNRMTREQLIAALLNQGMTFEDYLEKMRMQLLRFQLVSQDVRRKVVVTEQELLDYFRNHKEDYRQEPFLRLGYLDFSIDNPLASEKIRSRALEIQQQLRSGKSFGDILRTTSGEDHISGGELGKIRFEDLDPVYANAVRDLPEGGISEILETPDTLRLLYLEERNPGAVNKFEQVRAGIEKKLTDQRMEERFKEWAENLKKEARIEILL